MKDQKSFLSDLWWQGVQAVRGANAVKSTLHNINPEAPNLIIAVGKAAGDMALGARDHFSHTITTLVVTKYGHVNEAVAELPDCEIIEAAHPIPDLNSLIAGRRVLESVRGLGPTDNLMLLVSGGASALAEVLQPDMTLEELEILNNAFMSSGLSIDEINTERRKVSQIKGGQLLDVFDGNRIEVIAISDVEGDDINTIGSGIGARNSDHDRTRTTIAASNKLARKAVKKSAGAIPVCANEETLYGPVETVASHILIKIRDGKPGLYIFGGEPTVNLPENPGRGGRNQHLALLLADSIGAQDDIVVLVAGTDGTDGPTAEAGAIVDGSTVGKNESVADYLANADSGSYLNKCDALFATGPTGTNVMDLVIAYKAGQ